MESATVERTRAEWRKLLQWSDDCESAYTTTGVPGSGVIASPVAGGTSLVQITCASGAYQPTQIFYLFDGKMAKLLKLDIWEASGADGEQLVKSESEEISGLAEFQPAQQVLTVWNKFRGPGDCGSWTAYAITPAGATVKELRAKVQCDGVTPPRPEDMPVVQRQ